jgi:hypothetical protein
MLSVVEHFMKSPLIFAIVALVSVGCSKHSRPESGGDTYILKRIVGTWKVDETSPKGVSALGVNSILKDGTFTSRGTLNRGDFHMDIAFAGTWQINQGILIETITNTSNTNLIHFGLVTRDTILSVDDQRLVYRGKDGRVISRDRIQ